MDDAVLVVDGVLDADTGVGVGDRVNDDDGDGGGDADSDSVGEGDSVAPKLRDAVAVDVGDGGAD